MMTIQKLDASEEVADSFTDESSFDLALACSESMTWIEVCARDPDATQFTRSWPMRNSVLHWALGVIYPQPLSSFLLFVGRY